MVDHQSKRGTRKVKEEGTNWLRSNKGKACDINQCIHKVVISAVTKPLQIYGNVNVHDV